jgi:hypothetical protein
MKFPDPSEKAKRSEDAEKPSDKKPSSVEKTQHPFVLQVNREALVRKPKFRTTSKAMIVLPTDPTRRPNNSTSDSSGLSS